MHIKDLWKLRHHDQHLPTETSPADGFKLPVAVELVLETPVVRGQQMIDGVKSIKETPWYGAYDGEGCTSSRSATRTAQS